MIGQSSTFSLPLASIDSMMTMNSKSIGHRRCSGIGDDLVSFFEQEVSAFTTLVDLLGETLTTEESATSDVESLGVAQHSLDHSIVAH